MERFSNEPDFYFIENPEMVGIRIGKFRITTFHVDSRSMDLPQKVRKIKNENSHEIQHCMEITSYVWKS